MRKSLVLAACALVVESSTPERGLQSGSGAVDLGVDVLKRVGLRNPLAQRVRHYDVPDSDVGLPTVEMPPDNYFLSRGAWPSPHRTGYAQGSSSGHTFENDAPLTHDELYVPLVTANPINLLYSNNNQYLWGSSFTSIFRVDRSNNGLKLAGTFRKSGEFDMFHGAYSLVNRDDVFIVASGARIEYFYGCGDDCIAKFPEEFVMPNAGDDESLRALCMLHDGKLAYASNRGRVGVTHQDIYGENVTVAISELQLEGDEMSNGIACDEHGGIYVVTNHFLHKIVWNGEGLEVLWKTKYEDELHERQPGRLGTGSGSTPSLMGSWKSDAGMYVVLTDGAPQMSVVVISALDGRVVGSHLVTFGDPRLEVAQSEQSVLVFGWRFAVVNNSPNSVVSLSGGRQLQFLRRRSRETANSLLAANPLPMDTLTSNLPGVAGHSPTGIEQFRFDPSNHTIETTWANRRVSFPNGIPTMCASTGVMYGVGKRSRNALEQIMMPGKYRGVWTLEGVDWWSGEHVLSYPIGSSILRNPVYAAAQVGPGEIVSGNAGGLVRIRERVL